ncbi:MAG: hypothetical protein ACRD6W_18040, partial [Nitrososphaerales archaeon]
RKPPLVMTWQGAVVRLDPEVRKISSSAVGGVSDAAEAMSGLGDLQLQPLKWEEFLKRVTSLVSDVGDSNDRSARIDDEGPLDTSPGFACERR